MNFVKSVTTAIALAAAPMVQAEERPPLTIFASDTSASVAQMYDQVAADEAARYVSSYIAGLDAPHRLAMISVGDAGLGHRAIDIRATVTNHRATNASVLARQFGSYFQALPGLVRDGRLNAQGSTSLIDFFEALRPICDQGDVTIILFSDGVESTASFDGRAFIEGRLRLPEPRADFLTGCRVEIHGVGQLRSTSNSNGLAGRLLPQWERFLTNAGADPVLVTGSFYSF
ncbi:hypothetical protein NBRC116601_11800 [Cognatishimia sp. WU-CL00825]|uniref:hypothetical protein n=1 Tax=Cognatishimia sp. WU-CL00825 TaxID=3127658 RepID=UPI0031046F2C